MHPGLREVPSNCHGVRAAANVTDPSTRRMWPLPHETLLLTCANPLKERKHSDNPSRLKMLREHGPAGLLLFAANAASNVLAGVAVICGAGLLLAGLGTAGYPCILLGIVTAALTLPRALQIRACRPDEIPSCRGGVASVHACRGTPIRTHWTGRSQIPWTS